jgi:glycosyltransferase involved in cell wall biosynthesis
MYRNSSLMRVLYFIGSYSPELMGNAGHEEVILALRERGHEIDVLTQINDRRAPKYDQIEYKGVPVYRINLAHPAKGPRGLLGKAAGKLLQYEHTPTLHAGYRQHLAQHQYDLVHVEGVYPFGFVAALASRGTPYMANVQGADVILLPENDYGYRRFRLARVAVGIALRRAALVRVNSPFMVGYLAKERLAPPSRVVMVPRVLEESAFPPPAVPLEEFRRESRAMLSQRYGIGLPYPVVMSLSRLHPFKGLEYLVDAMPLVAEAQRALGKQPPWFVLAGPSRSTEHYGDYKDFLRQRAQAAGVGGNLLFTGQVPHAEVRQHLAGADVVASPSVVEALHRVALEAAAVGTPSVVSETTGAASYLAPQDACLAVEPRSPHAIADAIVRLLNEPGLYKNVTDNGLRVAESLKVGSVAPQLEVVWKRVVSTIRDRSAR